MIYKIFLKFTIFAIILAGCSTKQSSVSKAPDFMLSDNYFGEIVEFDYNENIGDLLNSVYKYEGSGAGGDCSGFITLLNSKNDEIYFNPNELHKHMTSYRKSEGIYNLYAANKGIFYKDPKPGDLIFFHNTTNNTKNSKKKHITHIGVIRDVYKDGRVSFVHNTRGKNKIDFMNLNRKNVNKTGSITQNSYIVRCKRGDSRCLASNKFAGYGRVAR